MFKLVVLSALLAFAVAKPSGLLHAPAVAAYSSIAVPAAVSHQSRVDVISKPVVATYAAPALAYAAAPALAYAAPAVAYSAPIVQKTVVSSIPAAVSHTSRVDVHSSPVAYAAAIPAVAAVHSAPLVHAW